MDVDEFYQKFLLEVGVGLLLLGFASFQLYETVPNCFPKWLSVYSVLAIYKNSHQAVFSPIYGIIR